MVEQFQSLRESALRSPQGSFEAEQPPLWKQLVAGLGAGTPEVPGTRKRLVGSIEVVADPAGVADMCPTVPLSPRAQALLDRHPPPDGQGQLRQLQRLAGVTWRRPQARRAHPRRQGRAPKLREIRHQSVPVLEGRALQRRPGFFRLPARRLGLLRQLPADELSEHPLPGAPPRGHGCHADPTALLRGELLRGVRFLQGDQAVGEPQDLHRFRRITERGDEGVEPLAGELVAPFVAGEGGTVPHSQDTGEPFLGPAALGTQEAQSQAQRGRRFLRHRNPSPKSRREDVEIDSSSLIQGIFRASVPRTGVPPYAVPVLNRRKETLLNDLVAGGSVLGTPEPSAREDDLSTGGTTAHRQHHQPSRLEGLVRGGLPRPEARAIVRHLLRGCDECRRVVRQIWALGNRESIEADIAPVRKTS